MVMWTVQMDLMSSYVVSEEKEREGEREREEGGREGGRETVTEREGERKKEKGEEREKPSYVLMQLWFVANTKKERVTCDTNEFPCLDGLQCIPDFSLCDDIEQCADGSDENECRKN